MSYVTNIDTQKLRDAVALLYIDDGRMGQGE